MTTRALLILGFAAMAAWASGQEWARWLGPSQNGSAAAPGTFSGRPSVTLRKAWSHAVEGGQSAVVSAGGLASTLASYGDADYVVALDLLTGRERWRVRLDPLHAEAQGPASTPAAFDGRLFAVSTACVLRALDQATGKTVWEVDLKVRFKANPGRGCTSSPFVEDGRLIVQPANREENRAAALDPRTGETLWTAKGAGRAPYSSPVAARLAGVAQVLVHDVHDAAEGARPRSGLAGLRVSDGGLLWNTKLDNNLSFETPLVLPRDQVLLVTWNDAHLFQVAAAADKWNVRRLWTTADLLSRAAPPVYHDGHLYGFGGDFLACLDAASGKARWKERLYPGSLILVDGRLVVLGTNSGLLRVVDATPAAYHEQARLEVLNRGSSAEAPPSFASGRIFVRNDEEVVAVTVEAGS
jgi:outer membrane protein assembly factor BamB